MTRITYSDVRSAKETTSRCLLQGHVPTLQQLATELAAMMEDCRHDQRKAQGRQELSLSEWRHVTLRTLADVVQLAIDAPVIR